MKLLILVVGILVGSQVWAQTNLPEEDDFYLITLKLPKVSELLFPVVTIEELEDGIYEPLMESLALPYTPQGQELPIPKRRSNYYLHCRYRSGIGYRIEFDPIKTTEITLHPIFGDINEDNVIDDKDLSILKSVLGAKENGGNDMRYWAGVVDLNSPAQARYPGGFADFDGDKQVTGFDLLVLLYNFGKHGAPDPLK
ncbi:MAG: hypothetical protein JST40_07845 [Armatimonadetes bacterium]|nr:hypothetical protein [Armatimonadota bacterium]